MEGTTRRRPIAAAAFLLAVVTALLFAGATSTAAAGDNGFLDICKLGAPGTNVAGSTFSFKVVKAQGTPQTVTVTPPFCSNTSLPPGRYTITETLSSGGLDYVQTGATTVPESALLSENATLAKTKVLVTAGQDTTVKITNALAPSDVKVCKTSNAFGGKQFSFTVAGTPVTAIADGACSDLVHVQTGSVITVSENVPDLVQVTSIDVTHGTGFIKRQLSPSSVRFVVGNGANVLTFNNEPLPPSQNGRLEICKDAGDEFIGGTYQYTIKDGAQTFTASVGVGQCTSAINGQNGGIPAGSVTITEAIPPNQALTNVFLGFGSAGQLGTVNKINGTAVVVVPIAAAGEVQVHFVNSTNTAQLKVCKLLAPNSAALAGQKFTFDVTDDAFAAGTSYPVSVTVPAGSTGQCSVVKDSGQPVVFPIGSTATVTERNSRPYVDAGNGLGKPDTESLKITSGINELDFTNTAFGQLEICKHIVAGDPDYGQTFTFTYQNDAVKSIHGTITTASGVCSMPVTVPAGTYTVTEDLSNMTVTLADGTKVPAYQFVASDARGPLGDSRCHPQATYPQPLPANAPPPPPNGGCGQTLDVTVPWTNPADLSTGITEVAFWDKLTRGSVKICKVIDPHSTATLNSLVYTFNASSGGTTYGPFTLAYPFTSCPTFGDIPLMNANGTPATVTVTETLASSFEVQSVTVSPGAAIAGSPDLATGTIVFNPGPGTNTVIFTNIVRCAGPAGAIPAGTPGTAAFHDASQQAVAFGCAVYVTASTSRTATDLELEFIRGPNTGTAIPIGPNNAQLSDLAMTSGGSMYGVDLAGTFYTVSPVTGAATVVATVATTQLAGFPNALVVGPTGTVYANQSLAPGYFDTIDPGTGVATFVGNSAVSSGDLAFLGSGSLYMTVVGAKDDLYTVNPSNGSATLVGQTGATHVFGLVGSYGSLFGFTDSGTLLSINSTTGAATVITTGGPAVQGAASPPNLA